MFHVSAADHQRPTHARLHLRDARDAQIILEAVRLGILQIVTRRLNEVRALFCHSIVYPDPSVAG